MVADAVVPAGLSEAVLSERIQECEMELEKLYRQRAGQLVEDSDGIGWCVMCGREQVNCFDGYDTCRGCSS